MKKFGNFMKSNWHSFLIVVLGVVFCVSVFFVGKYIYGSHKQSQHFEELSQMVDSSREETRPTAVQTQPAETTAATEGPTVPTEPKMIKEYAEVHALNEDVAGWIQILGTKVNYPVMHTPEDPNFYLKRDFNHEYSDWGCIYAREECDLEEPSDNVTIYGHNMIDCSMFGDLKEYEDRDFWQEHRLIYFDTLYEYHIYEIFAVFKTSASIGEGFSYHSMVDAADQEEFDRFVATCKELSFYDTGITPIYGDKLICLSTCEYTLENGRFVVAARRIY